MIGGSFDPFGLGWTGGEWGEGFGYVDLDLREEPQTDLDVAFPWEPHARRIDERTLRARERVRRERDAELQARREEERNHRAIKRAI